jgi:hypothetical protein
LTDRLQRGAVTMRKDHLVPSATEQDVEHLANARFIIDD